MLKRSIILLLALILLGGGGVFIWRAQDTWAKEARTESEILNKLTVEDINLVLKSQADEGVTDINDNPETRRAFLNGMREYLALASAARREGMTEDINFKINFAHKKNILLADLFQAKLTKDSGNYYVIPRNELDGVLADPANVKQFDTDMAALRAIQNAVAMERGENFTVSELKGGSLVKARDNWSRTKILSDRAKSDAEFMARPEISLRTKILEAGILSADYLRKHWDASIKATESDIASYLGSHPEYDPKVKRERAELVLRRVKAGEDFNRLAAEFSEDRTTKDKGGLHENMELNLLWPEVEQAALAMSNNQIADQLVETEIGYHIVKLVNKQQATGDMGVRYSLQHILLQKKFEDPANTNPNIPSPFLSAEEIAKSTIEKDKRNRFVEQIIQRSEINLPDDFIVG